jgi:tetratricopeptide (TPR) repeat protein
VRKEQYLVLIGGLIFVTLLYYFGRTKEAGANLPAEQGSQIEFSDYEALQVNQLPEEDAEAIRQLKSALISRPGLENNLALAQAWEAMGNYPLGAFYFYESALINSDSISWEAAGDKLLNSYKTYGDSLISNNLITFALASYDRALLSDKDNLDLQMKLAECYVESPNPMQGIVMLREIADSIPDYVPAQMRLGRLSLQTGQNQKALERFQQVLKTDPVNTEALYFLALANEGLGNLEETIRLLELCKRLVDNPAFSQEIDVYIDKLKK